MTERCPRCKTVVWQGLWHDCLGARVPFPVYQKPDQTTQGEPPRMQTESERPKCS